MSSKVVLMVAAERREFSGLLRFVRSRPVNWGLQFSCEGDLNGNRIVMIADGPGPQLAGGATDVARRYVRPDTVVSAGFCGALDASLRPGDVVVAEEVIDADNGGSYIAQIPQCGQAYARGKVASAGRVATTMADRMLLRNTGACAVEMEAAAVAARARVWDVPFFCIRVVSDAADRDFPLDFNRTRDARGRFSRSRIVLAAAMRPWSRAPFLLKLDRSCRMASGRLGEFFANCRF